MSRVEREAVLRAWEADPNGGPWLLVSGSSYDVVIDAVVEANEASEACSVASEEGDNVLALPEADTPDGFVLFLRGHAGPDAVERWLDHLAAALASRGAAGIVSVTGAATLPDWYRTSRELRPMGFLMWRLDRPRYISGPGGSWVPSQRETSQIVRILSRWADIPAGLVVFREGTFEYDLPAEHPVRRWLALAISRSNRSGYLIWDQHRPRANQVDVRQPCEASVDYCDSTVGWRDRVDSLTDLLVQAGPRLELGFIRQSGAHYLGWPGLHQLPHGLSAGRLRRLRYLLDEYVVDACGVQVLQPSHLRKIRNISRWQVVDLPGERHLVRAQDLEPWYSGEHPDPDVLADAREDFADLFLTDDMWMDNRLPQWAARHYPDVPPGW